MTVPGARVLFLPHNLRYGFFSTFLEETKRVNGWHIGVTCPEESRKAFFNMSGSTADVFFLPEFSRRAKWEGEPSETSRIFRLISEAERTTRIPANRILLLSERDFGRAYSERNYYWPLNRAAVAARRHPALREAYLLRLFHFMDRVITTFNPSMILSGLTGAPLTLATYMIARVRNLPFVVNRYSKLLSNRVYWTADPLMFNLAGRADYERRRVDGIQTSAQALRQLEDFRERPRTVAYIQRNWRAGARNWAPYHRGFLEMAKAKAAHKIKRRKGQTPKPTLSHVVAFYLGEYLKIRQRGFLTRIPRQQLAQSRYVYYAMHKEPELAINFIAPEFHDQWNLVARISSILPMGVRLLVREHRFNLGRRPTAYYRSLCRLPGVTLIDALDDQFKYISAADVVITDNGSTGWEGLLLGRPVVTLASTFYDAPQLQTKALLPADLEEGLLRLLSYGKPASMSDYDERLCRLIDAEFATTIEEKAPAASHVAEIAKIIASNSPGRRE